VGLRTRVGFSCLAVFLFLSASPSPATTRRVSLGDGVVAALADQREIHMEALPRDGEGLLSFARRFCGTTEFASIISEANGGSKKLLSGVRYRIPFSVLLPEHQLQIAKVLFAADRTVAAGWVHRVEGPSATGVELWWIADWFTGRGENFRAIREVNHLADDQVKSGESILIPAQLLRPAFRGVLPPSSPYYLEYGEDANGGHAIYRLKPGEALYSSVVVRFTGNVYAQDVNALAAEIARNSKIPDVTDIPVGYAVKIPFDVLLPEFLPAGHPARREYEAGLVASAQYSNRVLSRSLEGITVVLDAGHGGEDVGASVGGVWESLYVYDIMVRVKTLLESTTAATVIPTTRDGATFNIPARDSLPFSRGHSVLTNPIYQIVDSTVGLHLRWYLANSVFRAAVKAGTDPGKVVFLSIHADSLHPSLRGVMVYVPGARWRSASYGRSGTVYASRREVREKPTVTFASNDSVKSEGLSRELANKMIGSFARADLPVHEYKPVRDKIVRNRRSFIPAVLRYNQVPAEALIEVCNLSNKEDLKQIKTQKYRQSVAEAIVAGVLDYYGQDVDRNSQLKIAASNR